jgi:hypothetical protein
MILDINEKIQQAKKETEERKEITVSDDRKVTDEIFEETMINQRKKSSIDYENGIFEFNGRQYTFEELYDIYLRNESFVGKISNAEKVGKYFELAKLVNELNASCEDVTNLKFSKPERTSQWACIHVDFLWMMSLDKEQLAILKRMMELVDDFSINGSSFKTVRMSFGINGIWKK